MALFGTALVQGVIVDRVFRTVAPGTPRKRALAVVRQQKSFGDAPVAGKRQVRHGLAQFGAVTGVLDDVQLVDDIDEVVQLGHAPEYAVDAQPKLPGILVPVSIGQHVGLAQVRMCALSIGAVVTIKGGEGEAGSFCDVPVKRRFQDQPAGGRTLTGEGRRLRIPLRLRAQLAGELKGLRLGTGGGQEHEGRECAGGPHQRTRRSAVWVNSLSARSVRN